MGNKQDTESVVVNDKYDEHGVPKQPHIQQNNTNKPQFIPGFTTKTSTVVYGYIRDQFINDKIINQIIPFELIEFIYSFVKNNCTFIIIFENNNDRNHSYLHELDIESGTNINLSKRYNHKDHIWKRIPSASYGYGKYHDRTAIYRIAPKKEDSIVCTLRTGNVYPLPDIQRSYAQTVHSSNHGLFVIGGIDEIGQETDDVLYLNERENVWDNTKIKPMLHKRTKHLSLFYESSHYDISDKIFCLGSEHRVPISNVDEAWEYYDFKTAEWNQMRFEHRNTSIQIVGCGGCIDIESDKLIIAGGSRQAGKKVEQYDFYKDKWYQIGTFTTYSHCDYPKVGKHNDIVVVFGNKGYSNNNYIGKDYGYVEYIDQRVDTHWTTFSSLRELLQFTGQQVRDGFYQHMLQM